MIRMKICRLLVLFAASLLAVPARSAPAVHISRLPEGSAAPSVAASHDGTVHLVYGREHNLFYARSQDAGRTFSTAVQLNTSSSAETAAERGPRMAIGRNGSLHVVWMAPRGAGVFYTRADAGGKFAPERNLLERADADGVAIATDKKGDVYVVWVDSRLGPDAASPVSKPIFMARSGDDGRTFAPNAEVRSDYPGRACACCSLAAEVDPRGELVIGFRGAYLSVRDMHIIRGSHATRVSDDGWKFDGCPMSGPVLDASARPVLAAWMSQGDVYFAAEGKPRVAPEARKESARNYPLVVRNERGETLFAWTEGGKVKWETRGRDGALGGSGEAAGPEHKSRPTALAARDGSFVLVY